MEPIGELWGDEVITGRSTTLTDSTRGSGGIGGRDKERTGETDEGNVKLGTDRGTGDPPSRKTGCLPGQWWGNLMPLLSTTLEDPLSGLDLLQLLFPARALEATISIVFFALLNRVSI